MNNQTYIDERGACHFAYHPVLLASESRNKILAGLEDHNNRTPMQITGITYIKEKHHEIGQNRSDTLDTMIIG
ncbi:MAG: hypothetical protein JRJ04_02500 [Deltaproteobacteria bacterium]|nr:hypothetical protein [Deltaproteobacteria bacterium]